MDAVAPLCVFHGMAFYLLSQGYSAWWIWPIGLPTGASLLWHVSEYDVSKNIYLHASRPDFSLGGSTLLSPTQMRTWQKEFADSGERTHALLVRIWVQWTKPQLRALKPWLEPQRSPRDDAERDIYRSFYRRPMRVLSWLGFGTHLFVLTMAAAVTPWDVRAIWVSWLFILGPMNLLCAWVVLTRSQRERRYVTALGLHRSNVGTETNEREPENE
jgi:hypothetical protein